GDRSGMAWMGRYGTSPAIPPREWPASSPFRTAPCSAFAPTPKAGCAWVVYREASVSSRSPTLSPKRTSREHDPVRIRADPRADRRPGQGDAPSARLSPADDGVALRHQQGVPAAVGDEEHPPPDEPLPRPQAPPP